MPAKSKTKSIWRQPEAQHFQVVHRSQRDPLIHDADAPAHVLKQRQGRAGGGSGASRAQLEAALGQDTLERERRNVGEAAEYGIYYDDTEYDYMQHLRPIGGDDNVRRGGEQVEETEKPDVIMLEAPTGKKKGAGAAGKKEDRDFKLREEEEKRTLNLPEEVLPSKSLLPLDYGTAEARSMAAGLQPDMDPHLRQVLEALDDDAFLMSMAAGGGGSSSSAASSSAMPMEELEEGDEEDIDDFFSGVIAGGELDEDDEAPEWRALPPGGEESIWEDSASRAARELLELKQSGKGVEDLSLTSRLALFKAGEGRIGGAPNVDEEDDDANSETASTSTAEPAQRRATRKVVAPSSVGSQSIFGEKGSTRKSRHPGAKARLASSFYAPSSAGGSTAFSMSSSAMERNQGLTGLDEQFDRMERIYEQDSDEEEDEDGEVELDEDDDARAELHNLDGIFDDFLSKHEVIAGKLKERLGDRSATSAEKVDLLRRELGEVRLSDLKRLDKEDEEHDHDDIIPRQWIEGKKQEWDVETVLTTKTNLENRPRTINAAQSVTGASTTSRRPAMLGAGSSIRGGGSNSSKMGSVNGSNGQVDGDDGIMPKVRVNPRTGQAEIVGYIKLNQRQRRQEEHAASAAQQESSRSALSDEEEEAQRAADDDDEEYDSDATEGPLYNVTIARDRNESKEDKKERKQLAREMKQLRRQEKSERKASYAQARNKIVKMQDKKLAGGNAADVGRNGIGGNGQAIHLL